MEGITDFFDDPGTLRIKIGKTSRTSSERLRELNRGRTLAPTDFREIHTVRNSNCLRFEKILQEAFVDRSLNGEWFAMDLKDILLISKLNTSHAEEILDRGYVDIEKLEEIVSGSSANRIDSEQLRLFYNHVGEAARVLGSIASTDIKSLISDPSFDDLKSEQLSFSNVDSPSRVEDQNSSSLGIEFIAEKEELSPSSPLPRKRIAFANYEELAKKFLNTDFNMMIQSRINSKILFDLDQSGKISEMIASSKNCRYSKIVNAFECLVKELRKDGGMTEINIDNLFSFMSAEFPKEVKAQTRHSLYHLNSFHRAFELNVENENKVFIKPRTCYA